MFTAETFPRIISVDDHIMEPPNVWQDRLPAKFKDVGPRMVRLKIAEMNFVGGVFSYRESNEGEDGTWCDWWLTEDLKYPLVRLMAAAGYPREEVTVTPITMDDMRKGCWEQTARLEDMDTNHTDVSLSFPTFPRFCGQTFLERKDKELADLCVKAYNDWMFDEWCAGTNGRLVPLPIVQLWDANLAADEVRRNAARGGHAVCFTEIPPFLGLPSVHDKDGYWDPFFRACAETESVVCMHIGSSSRMPSTSADAPAAVGSTLTYMNAAMSMTDYLMSGILERFPRSSNSRTPKARSAGSPTSSERAGGVEGQHRVGWRRRQGEAAPVRVLQGEHLRVLLRRPARPQVARERRCRHNITFETDYPHSDSTWPHSLKVAMDIMEGLDDETIVKIVRTARSACSTRPRRVGR
jgi:hypothetical protein